MVGHDRFVTGFAVKYRAQATVARDEGPRQDDAGVRLHAPHRGGSSPDAGCHEAHPITKSRAVRPRAVAAAVSCRIMVPCLGVSTFPSYSGGDGVSFQPGTGRSWWLLGNVAEQPVATSAQRTAWEHQTKIASRIPWRLIATDLGAYHASRRLMTSWLLARGADSRPVAFDPSRTKGVGWRSRCPWPSQKPLQDRPQIRARTLKMGDRRGGIPGPSWLPSRAALRRSEAHGGTIRVLRFSLPVRDASMLRPRMAVRGGPQGRGCGRTPVWRIGRP